MKKKNYLIKIKEITTLNIIYKKNRNDKTENKKV